MYTLKGYWPRDDQNTLNKSLLSPDPVKRTVGEMEAVGGGVYVCFDGAVPRINCLLMLATANRHSFSFICRNC